ncbi:MAG: apolipoprotein N-acyltransferase, partial [Synechococcaceae cyanobacterium]|nr:apolipoprotein N-acyltransferase [Synechococcaceae cyanobacterium]
LQRLDPARLGSALLGASLWGLGASALPGDPALAGLGALGGGGAIAALQLLVGWCLWRGWARTGRRRGGLLAGAALVLAAHLAGAAALGASSADSGRRERVTILQPAIPTRSKFEAREQRRLLAQLAASLRLAAGEARGIDGLLLPEGALAPGQTLPDTAPVEVLSGGFRRSGEELRSAVLRFPPGGERPAGGIDKHRVVPLGEWVPGAEWLRWSGLSAVGGIAPGDASRLLERPAGPIGVAICYELSDGAALAASSRAGARWLLATANLDPYPAMLQAQFTALARLRAIETGRWLVSAANTGPSLLVDPRGRVRAALPAGTAATGTMTVPQRTGLTPYGRWGERPLLGLLLGSVGLRLARGGSTRPPAACS